MTEPGAGEGDRADAGPTDVDLRIPETATREVAAAIAAAIEAYLEEERAAESDREPSWEGRRWSLAGRLERLTDRPGRVPGGAPPDGWSVAGRADRF